MSVRPWRPLAALLLQALLVWLAAALVDGVGLAPDGEWPYLFAAASMTVGVSSWGVLATFLTGLVGRLATDPDVLRGAVWCGAVVAAPFGLLGIGGALLWWSGSGHAADVVMAAALLGGGVLPLLPLAGLVRSRRTD